MSAANPFAPAGKAALKARVAFAGPSGAGKTWTALEWARTLAGPDGRVAVIDTERRSSSLYAGRFDFDKIDMSPPFDPRRLVELVGMAESNGYAALVVDSLSHFWIGEGGALDLVDNAAGRNRGNTFSGWKDVTPIQRTMIDRLVSADLHVVATLRSKTEWVVEQDERGRAIPRRVGTAAVQRDGLEYEFDLVGELDLEHRLTFTKSRCDLLADTVIRPATGGEDPSGPARDAAEVFARWLDDGEPLAARNDVDALRAVLNGLPGPLRARFRSTFGDLRGITASRLVEARAWVDGIPDEPFDLEEGDPS